MIENKQYTLNQFIWETHGVHVGTGDDHIKHGIDEIEKIIELAIQKKHPNISFVIHSPRLTRFRYAAEKNTDIKFIRGDNAYFDYSKKITQLKEKYGNKINIKYGVELEWLGAELGIQWNRSKIFQAQNADFIIGSVHFSKEGIPYDGSKEETEKLIKLRGGIEKYWSDYIEEMIEMIDSSWEIIQIVGHIDLPKLYAPIPKPLLELGNSTHFLARRMKVLLEMISEHNLAIDLNLAGLKKKGIYPNMQILKRARKLDIPIAIGSDVHTINDYGENYEIGVKYAIDAEYNHYVSYSKCIPEKRPLENNGIKNDKYKILNLGIEILNKRFNIEKQRRIPKFSFGGSFSDFFNDFKNATSLGKYEAIRIRKETKSITISNKIPKQIKEKVKGLFSKHMDKPGALSILFNTLASEEINVETAYLNSNEDGTATAFLTLSGDDEMIKEAVEFIKGTAGNIFINIEFGEKFDIPNIKKSDKYLLEVDGVDLPIAISKQMILTVHNNVSGILLILLSALASQKINVTDLQLGKRGCKGYVILGVDGDEQIVSGLLTKLGPQFYETSHFMLNNFDKE